MLRPALALGLALLILPACTDEADPDAGVQTDPEELVEVTADPADEPDAELNLNTTPEATFAALPGVGDRMAHEFVEYRPYVSIQQFRREMGKYVDDDQIEAYERLVFVPVRPNDSDAETLAQLPGVELDEAALLMDARPFDSEVAFLAALEPLVTPEEQALAADYLASE